MCRRTRARARATVALLAVLLAQAGCDPPATKDETPATTPTRHTPAASLLEPAPSLHELVPGLHETAPGLHEPTPGLLEPTPSVHDPAPGLYEPAPGLLEPEPGLREPAPGLLEPIPSVHEPAPGLREPAPGLLEPLPCVHEPASGLHEPAPSVHEPAPGLHEPAPSLLVPTPDPPGARRVYTSVTPKTGPARSGAVRGRAPPEDEYKERQNFDNDYFSLVAAAEDSINKNAVPTGPASSMGNGNASVAGFGTAVTDHEVSTTTLAPAPARVHVTEDESFCLPCAATDHPPPPPGGPSTRNHGAGAVLYATRAAGTWLCRAGADTLRVDLRVARPLPVALPPVPVGGAVRLHCERRPRRGAAAAAAASWPRSARRVLCVVVARAAAGAYRCIMRETGRRALTHAELHLTGDRSLELEPVNAATYEINTKRVRRETRADPAVSPESPPELRYTFIEQVLRPGGDVSLRCEARGTPAPRVAWLRDDVPLASHRYSVSEEPAPAGGVVSVLNISAAAPADGGRYTCRAHNARGHAAHSARLNIYGPPSVRAVPALRLVAGANASVFCPYAGYPISSVTWWRGAARLGAEGRVRARGAELRLEPAAPPDAGHYACSVAAPAGAGPPARADLEIQVRNPPKISPFMFSSELTEGSSAQVLCGVSSGDKPMYFSWFKDGAPLPPNLQIEEKSLNEFSLLMFSDLTARHSGDYTCRVTNHAAAVDYTATLSVKVAPSWISEPRDAALLLDAPLQLRCVAAGHPPPTVVWYRRTGVGGEGAAQWEALGDGGEGLRARGGELRAGGATRVLAGTYRCVADNGVGVPLQAHVNVTVHEPAQLVEAGAARRNVSVSLGAGARLHCAARGDDPLALAWTRRGAALPGDDYRWSVSESRSAQTLHSTLSLRAAERSDAGEYRCVATNRFGRSERLILLHVEEPPAAPSSLRAAGRGARWAGAAWSGPARAQYRALLAAPRPPDRAPSDAPLQPTAQELLNLTLDSVLDNGPAADGLRSLRARVRGLRAATRYSLRLLTVTSAGLSAPSDPLVFTTLEDVPTGAPRDVRVTSSGDGELHVTWAAPLRDDWNGELLGYAVSWRELRDGGEGEGEGEGEGSARAGRVTVRGGGARSATLVGLRAATRHRVAVRAFTRAGPGPARDHTHPTAPTGVSGRAPRGVRCEGVSARELRVRWEPVAAPALRGYDLHYVPVDLDHSWSSAVPAGGVTQTADGRAAVVGGLLAATNYSVSVRARSAAGPGRASAPIYCATGEDVGGVVTAVRARSAGAEAVVVVWLPPERARRGGLITHYTLHIRELGKVGGEWSQRVEAPGVGGAGEGAGEGVGGEREGEVVQAVRGLRARAGYEFRVRAHTARGPGALSRAASAAPADPVAVRVWSFSRDLTAEEGARVRLRCGAEGAPPLRRRWAPLAPHHSLTDAGDLVLNRLEAAWAGNYTCWVRNAAGEDSVTHRVRVPPAPSAPAAPRLLRATAHSLTVAWHPPPSAGLALIGYTVEWRLASDVGGAGAGGSVWVPAGDGAAAARGLACGAAHLLTLRTHTARGTSPPSAALRAHTRGDKAEAPPGDEFVWANSTALRLNLLAWGGAGRCAVAAWRLALRAAAAPPAPPAAWHVLPVADDVAQADDLRPGTWYEIRVAATSSAGETTAVYRAATLALDGEPVGAAALQASEGRAAGAVEGAGTGAGGVWRGAVPVALLAAALAALIGALVALSLLRRRAEHHSPAPTPAPPPSQIYSTEPGRRNGKTLGPPDDGDASEISPYATFSMSMARGGAGALQLHTFGRAEPRGLAAAPPEPRSGHHHTSSSCGVRGRDSDSDSSGSSCAACRRAPAPLTRAPHAAAGAALDGADVLHAPWGPRSACGSGGPGSAGGTGPRGGGGRRRGHTPIDRPRERRRDAT